MDSKKKCRQYSVEFLKYGFIVSPKNEKFPQCHSDKINKDVSYFQELKAKAEKRELFKKRVIDSDKSLLASYKVALLIAKCGEPHTIVETLVLPAAKTVAEIMLGEGASNKLSQSVHLSNDTVSKQIDEMAADVESKLTHMLKKRKFALQIDESIVIDNKAILLTYVRYINEQKEMTEEMLFARSLITDMKGSSIFNVLKEYFEEKDIPLSNVSACATDGALAMSGHHAEFLAHLKKEVPGVITIHCVIHRQHLAAKKLSGILHETLQLVINGVNVIKASPPNDRLFRQLCHENDEEFERLLLHTAVRWLLKGICLRRFFELFETVTEFLDSCDPRLGQALRLRKIEIAYLADIFQKVNEFNMELQGNKMNLIKAKGIISLFIAEIAIFKGNIGRGELCQFPCLQKCSLHLQDDQIFTFTDHLDKLKCDMETRFEDIANLQIPDWIFDPFSFEAVDTIEPSLQVEFLDLKYDFEAEVIFKNHGYELAWVKIMESHPKLWEIVESLLISFPSTYLVEKGFSSVVQLLTQQRNKFDICTQGDLRLQLTNIQPDIQALTAVHQAQGSN